MRLSAAAYNALRVIGGAAGRRTVTLICTVEGGIACRTGEGAWDDPAIAPLAALLIRDLGYKTVEHAARREVVIRCALPNGGCTVDRGAGFEPLAVENGDVRG